MRASSLESRKPAVHPNNSSKFKPAAGLSSTVAGTKNGSVSEKGASSNGIEYYLSYNAYIHEHIIAKQIAMTATRITTIATKNK